jgi:hypothetical protein
MNEAHNTHSATGAGTNKLDAGAGNVQRQFSLRVVGNAADSVVALETSPDNTTWTSQATVTGDGWAYAASSHTRRYARPNVTSLGAGAAPLATTVCSYT